LIAASPSVGRRCGAAIAGRRDRLELAQDRPAHLVERARPDPLAAAVRAAFDRTLLQQRLDMGVALREGDVPALLERRFVALYPDPTIRRDDGLLF